MRFARKTALALSAATLLALPALAEERKLRPGRYELTTEMKMEGIDRQIPANTSSRCFTEDDVKDYKKMAQDGQGRNRDCETTDMKAEGNHVSYAMTCKSGAKGNGEMTFRPDGYDMTLDLETPGGPHGPMKMKIHTTAKRTGDCSK